MANITISDLRPVGADLFDGSENYLHDLTDMEIEGTNGGLFWVPIIATVCIVGFSIGICTTAL